MLTSFDSHREVWFACNANEVVRQIYDHAEAEFAAEWVAESGRDFTGRKMPFEERRLGCTIGRCAAKIIAWRRSQAAGRPRR